MGPDASSGDHPTLHTSTGEWQSFEQRMRQRRIDRLLGRARLARQEGHEDEARAALAEVQELTGEPAPETPTLPVEAAQIQAPQIIDVAVADGDLAIFDSELPVHVLDFGELEKEEADDDSADADLPLYPPYLITSDASRAHWGPRIAAALTGCLVLFWFTGPRLPRVPGTAAAEVQPQPAAVTSLSQTAVRRSAESPTPPVKESGSTGVEQARLAATDTTGAVVPVDSASPGTSPPVSLAGLEVAEPRATSPEPSARPDAPPPLTLPVESPPPASVATAVPLSSQPTLDVVTPPAPTPASPPVEAAPPPPAAAPPPTPSPVPAPPREAATPEVDTAAADGVRATLMRYESAYSRLDADAAGAVWPSLDRKALARAFEGLASQEVSLGSCEMRIVGDAAVADCAGSATWTPKVGGRSHRESRRWQFRLRNVDAGWQIVAASVR